MNIYVYRGHLVGTYGNNFRSSKQHDKRIEGATLLGPIYNYYFDYITNEIKEKEEAEPLGLLSSYREGATININLSKDTRVLVASMAMHEDFYMDKDDTLSLECIDLGNYYIRVTPVKNKTIEHRFEVVEA